ncbi:acetyltransferase [Lonsdalea britannica]|uniref:N-acetyltransferase n=1 Tax=Lonsdalea britannica TaxID=1082704 RepID=A0AAD0WK95_9GAMM|nr:GNAT family N-acetyltransferase [Lonsdalea britannica]AXW86614.1 N-acetyltransferase [Lonsdalea britannica]OSM93804.1 acetyltransferase [Lonsdalea britannica]OSN02079.1 acetyltransferase [Lonsdalea britannica]
MKTVLLSTSTLPLYRHALAGLLINAVEHGSSVGYRTPLSYEDAEGYFHELRHAIANGERLLWITLDENGVVGTVQLELCQKSNGQNRAEIQKMLVHQQHHRKGIGHHLLQTLEESALSLQRGLLYLDTEAGSAAELFYQSQGYSYLGEIPDYACTPEGTYHPTAIYYKRLFIMK